MKTFKFFSKVDDGGFDGLKVFLKHLDFRGYSGFGGILSGFWGFLGGFGVVFGCFLGVFRVVFEWF